MDVKSKIIEVVGRNVNEEKMMADLGVYALACLKSEQKFELAGVLKIIDENVDEKKLLKDAIAEVALPALDEVVAKSETKIDDVILQGAKMLLAAI